MYGIYEPMATLQYRYRSLSEQLEQFKTGEKYIDFDRNGIYNGVVVIIQYPS